MKTHGVHNDRSCIIPRRSSDVLESMGGVDKFFYGRYRAGPPMSRPFWSQENKNWGGNSQSVGTQRNGLDAGCDEHSRQRLDVCPLIGNNLLVAFTDVWWVSGFSEILCGEVGEALAVKFAFDVFQ